MSPRGPSAHRGNHQALPHDEHHPWHARGRLGRRFLIALFVAGGLARAQTTLGADRPIIGADLDSVESLSYPDCSAVLDVTKAPYLARGDGVTDCADALQKALTDAMGRHKILYLPEGVYLVSRTLEWTKKNSDGQDAWGFNTIQGQHPRRTIIRLKDATFTDPKSPKAIMWCGGFGSADWFHNYVQGVTFDVGRGNPGAIGLQFYSNNTGAVRDVAVVSGDGSGAIGLDLASRDMNGPLLVRDVEIRGFAIGIRTGGAVNSQTFERIRLTGQREIGFANLGQSISIRGLRSENAVGALRAGGFTAILDSELIGDAGADRVSAIQVGQAPFYARDVRTRGYKAPLAAERGEEVPADPTLSEFFRGEPTSPFATSPRSLRLPVRETPEVPRDNPATWAVVDKFGADPTGQADSSAAIQDAIDSGAQTVFFPGAYHLKSPVRVRGKARRLLGVGNWVDYNHATKPDLIIEDGAAPVVIIEHFAPINGGIEIRSNRVVVLRDVEAASIEFGGDGDIFLEDVCSNDLRFKPGQNIWGSTAQRRERRDAPDQPRGQALGPGLQDRARGHPGADLGGGSTEIFGNFSYTTTAGKLAPMFVTEDAAVFAFFNEVCFSGDPFQTLVSETRGKTTKVVRRGEGHLAPYLSRPHTSLKGPPALRQN